MFKGLDRLPFQEICASIRLVREDDETWSARTAYASRRHDGRSSTWELTMFRGQHVSE